MPTRDWLPGDLIVVLESSLIARCGTEIEQFTRGLQLGLVVQRSHQWTEPSALYEDSHMYYIVFFGSIKGDQKLIGNEHDDSIVSPGFYRVPGNRIIHPDEVHNPARLFGSQRLTE
jgi:hypothetical protein